MSLPRAAHAAAGSAAAGRHAGTGAARDLLVDGAEVLRLLLQRGRFRGRDFLVAVLLLLRRVAAATFVRILKARRNARYRGGCERRLRRGCHG